MPLPTPEEVRQELKRRRTEQEPQAAEPDAGTPGPDEVRAELLSRRRLQEEAGEIGARPRSAIDFAAHVGRDLYRNVGALGQAAASPIQTAKQLGSLVSPGIRRAEGEGGGPWPNLELGFTPEQKDYVRYLVESYGGPRQILDKLYEEPVSAVGDLSMGLSLGGGAVRAAARGAQMGAQAGGAAGTASRAGRVAEGARRVGRVGAAADPLALLGNVGLGTARLVYKGAGPVPGLEAMAGAGLGATTGRGKAIRVALDASPEGLKTFTREMRSKNRMSEFDIVTDARDSISRLRQKRAAEYRSRLEGLKQSELQIDLGPIRERLDGLLDEFRVKRRAAGEAPAPTPEAPTPEIPESSLDFSSTAVGAQGQRTVEDLVNLVDNWSDTSALGVDALKRQIADFYSDSNAARAFAADLHDTVRQALDSQVPGYKAMTSEYAEATRLIKLIDDELSTKQQTGTAVRKLSNALVQNSDYRQMILEMLDEAGQTDLLYRVAGNSMRSLTPTGIMRPITAGALLWTAGGGLMGAIPGIALASPRLVGEALVALSALKRGSATLGLRLRNAPPGSLVYRPLEAMEQGGEPETEEAAAEEPAE